MGRMHVWEIYACRRKRVLSKPRVSEKWVWHGHLKMAHTKNVRPFDSNTSHQISGLEGRRKQSIWRRLPVTGLPNSILSSGSLCGSSIVLPMSPWILGAIGLTVNMFMTWTKSSSEASTGRGHRRCLKLGTEVLPFLRPTNILPVSLLPSWKRQMMSCLLELFLLFDKGKFSIFGPCKGSNCIWIVRTWMAMLKQNSCDHCLWRPYIHEEWKEGQKEHKTLCDDAFKDRYENSVKTPLRISLYIMYGYIWWLFFILNASFAQWW